MKEEETDIDVDVEKEKEELKKEVMEEVRQSLEQEKEDESEDGEIPEPVSEEEIVEKTLKRLEDKRVREENKRLKKELEEVKAKDDGVKTVGKQSKGVSRDSVPKNDGSSNSDGDEKINPDELTDEEVRQINQRTWREFADYYGFTPPEKR